MSRPKGEVFSIKQKIFATEYIKNGFDAGKAAVAAGYSEVHAKHNASRLLNYPHIKKFIDTYLKTKAKKMDITYEWKLKKLGKLIHRAIPDDDEAGIEAVTKTGSIGISAISEANRMQGHHSAEKHINASVSVDADLKQVQEEIERINKVHEREY